MIFTVDPTLVTDLRKTADDVRDKDLFEFRPFSAERVRFTRGGETFEFQKAAGQGENGTDAWQRVAGESTAAVESMKMDELLTKLSSLRAQSFSGTDAGTGLQAPLLSVAVSYDQGKFERIRLSRNGGDAFGAREGEPGAARLDASALDEAMKAFDALLAPPAAPAGDAPGK
jgi:hypothetical protein